MELHLYSIKKIDWHLLSLQRIGCYLYSIKNIDCYLYSISNLDSHLYLINHIESHLFLINHIDWHLYSINHIDWHLYSIIKLTDTNIWQNTLSGTYILYKSPIFTDTCSYLIHLPRGLTKSSHLEVTFPALFSAVTEYSASSSGWMSFM